MTGENMFGKVRGRFHEDGAQNAMRDQPSVALSAVACMDDKRMHEFAALFNRVFDKPTGGTRWQIVRKEGPPP